MRLQKFFRLTAAFILTVSCQSPTQQSDGSNLVDQYMDHYQFSVASDAPAKYIPFFGDQKETDIRARSVLAAVSSHHLLAGKQIAHLFQIMRRTFSKMQGIGDRKGHMPDGLQNNYNVAFPELTFIIIGPNHEGRGQAKIAISQRLWKTPFGVILPDQKLINEIKQFSQVQKSEESFYLEHSIGALVPFIAYYFPQAKIAPLVIHYSLQRKDAASLGDFLAKKIKSTKMKNVILLISTDFVHDKPASTAEAIDRHNRDVLENPQKYLSPASIQKMETDFRNGILLLTYFLHQFRIEQPLYLDNTHSGKITEKKIPVTSYFFALYGQNEHIKQ